MKITSNLVNNMFSLQDKVAIVTGATGALGNAVALAYGLSGAKVVITGRNIDKLNDTAVALKEQGVEVSVFVADPSIESEVEALVKFATSTYGEVNVLAVCHGYNAPKPFLEQSVVEWQQIIDADLKSVYIVCQKVALVMKEQGRGGKIVVTSSARSRAGMNNYTGYCASKGGCDLMVQSMACDLTAKYGINVNSVNPTVFRSDLTEWMFDENSDVHKNVLRRLPIGRLGEPDDFIGLFIFLASNASNFLTGGNYDATGGYWSC